jgi:hypothetical protein
MKVWAFRKPSAPSRRSKILLASAGAAAVIPLLSAAASPAATSISDCGSSFDPYQYTPSALAACGYATFPQVAVNAMAGGGSSYDYQLDDGGTVRFYVPPASFDPSTATDAQLDEYGFPPRPTDPDALSQWNTEMNGYQGVDPPPSFLTESNVVNDTVYYQNWSGYAVTEPQGTFTHAEAVFVEPTFGSSRCSTNMESTWAGIGGFNPNTVNLAQNGTAHNEPGIGNHQAWWEILPGRAFPVAGFGGRAGYWFDASTRKITGGFRFYFFDYYSGKAKAFDVTKAGGYGYDGSSAEAIAERPSVNGVLQNLSNFGTLTFISARANGNGFNTFDPNGHRHGIHMQTNSGHDLADPSGIGTSGQFTDTQHNCN